MEGWIIRDCCVVKQQVIKRLNDATTLQTEIFNASQMESWGGAFKHLDLIASFDAHFLDVKSLK